LEELIGPLVELADRAGLVGVTNIAEASAALAPYGVDQIRVAVAKTAAMTRSGKIKSPIGWLITKARGGDENFFPSKPPTTGATPPITCAEQVDLEANTAVAALEADPVTNADQLAGLDSALRSGVSPILAARIFADPARLHDARSLTWRDLRRRPPIQATSMTSRKEP